MDITLQRIASLLEKKPDGSFKHGEIAKFAKSLGYSNGNTVTGWFSGTVDSYKGKLYEIAEKYNVSVEWLKGETDIKEKAPALSGEDSEFDSIFSQLNAQNKKIALAQLKALLDNQ